MGSQTKSSLLAWWWPFTVETCSHSVTYCVHYITILMLCTDGKQYIVQLLYNGMASVKLRENVYRIQLAQNSFWRRDFLITIKHLSIPSVFRPTATTCQGWRHTDYTYEHSFFGAFAKLQTATISFVMSVCPYVSVSVRPLGTNRLRLDGFSLKVIMGIFEYLFLLVS